MASGRCAAELVHPSTDDALETKLTSAHTALSHCRTYPNIKTREQSRGFSIVEIVVVLVLVGLLLGAGLVATELVASARVNSLIAQQDGIRAAFLAFEERYRAPPGDY